MKYKIGLINRPIEEIELIDNFIKQYCYADNIIKYLYLDDVFKLLKRCKLYAHYSYEEDTLIITDEWYL